MAVGIKKSCTPPKLLKKLVLMFALKFEVNFRAVYDMRTIGGDHTSLE